MQSIEDPGLYHDRHGPLITNPHFGGEVSELSRTETDGRVASSVGAD